MNNSNILPENNDNKNKWIVPLAKTAILCGIAAFLISFVLFSIYVFHLGNKRPLISELFSQYGSFLSGFAGSIFSVGAMLLLYATYNTQKQELDESRKKFNEQNSIMITQQNEAMFFKLLENHRDLARSISYNSKNGYEGLDTLYSEFQNCFRNYHSALKGEVNPNVALNMDPYVVIQSRKEIFEQLANNNVQIISHIISTLRNNDFYHTIFYNTMSSAEKFFWGMNLILFPDKYSEMKKSAFNYDKYYRKSELYYDRTQGTLPKLLINLSGDTRWSVISGKETFPVLAISTYDDELTEIASFSLMIASNIPPVPIPIKTKVIKGQDISIGLFDVLEKSYLNSVIDYANKKKGGEMQPLPNYWSIPIKLSVFFESKNFNYNKSLEIRVNDGNYNEISIDLNLRL